VTLRAPTVRATTVRATTVRATTVRAVTGQAALFEHSNLQQVVNVSSIKQLSPFRYPGGKTWFVPYLRKWFSSLPNRPSEFIEPFVGGGSLASTVLSENLADHVTMVELDEQVIAVWQAIFQGHANSLAERIVTFDLTLENTLETLASEPQNVLDRAFQTILKNRVNRGGILAPGAGMIKEGENGKGLRSRWYPETLSTRILTLAAHRDRVSVIHGDGITELENRSRSANVVALLDPPYTAGGKRAGSRLYRHATLDHERLFAVARAFTGDFVMTYDHAPEVLRLSQTHGLETTLVAMKNTHHEVMDELLVGRRLGWVKG
jgi:DNA adenine methylase